MANFSHLLNRPFGNAKKPPNLPAGSYSAIITKTEYGNDNKNKTPYCRITFRYGEWPDGVEPIEDFDLSKRTGRKDFYLTDDSLWRFEEFLSGFSSIEKEGRTTEEIAAELTGQMVLVDVTQVPKQDSDDEFVNRIGNVIAGE